MTVQQTRSSTVAFWAAYGLLALALICFVLPLLETRFFPVYDHFKPVTAIQTPEGVLATFEFNKLRTCDPRGSHWYVANSVSVNVTIPVGLAGPEPRPLGKQLTSPYLIEGVTLEDLRDPNRLMAQVRSQCNFPLLDFFGLHIQLPWITVSDVYP